MAYYSVNIQELYTCDFLDIQTEKSAVIWFFLWNCGHAASGSHLWALLPVEKVTHSLLSFLLLSRYNLWQDGTNTVTNKLNNSLLFNKNSTEKNIQICSWQTAETITSEPHTNWKVISHYNAPMWLQVNTHKVPTDTRILYYKPMVCVYGMIGWMLLVSSKRMWTVEDESSQHHLIPRKITV